MSRSVSERSRRARRTKAAASTGSPSSGIVGGSTGSTSPPGELKASAVAEGPVAAVPHAHTSEAAHPGARPSERTSVLDREITLTDVYERLGFLRRILAGFGLIEILAMALAVRALWVLSAGFPLNDGGLFYVFASDIQANGYVLPAFSSYNDGSIPLAYPPLAFYLAALLDDLTPLSLLDAMWVLPLAGSVAVVGAFYLLAKLLLKDRWTIVLASIIFLLAPRSFIWLIMGGGLTRALALALALVAIHQARRATRDHQVAPAVRAAVLLGLSVLTTLETAAWAVMSLPLFTLFPFESRQVFLRRALTLAGIGFGAFLVALPWAATVISNHGLEPFLAAREYGGSAIGNLDFITMWGFLRNPIHTGEPYFPLIAGLGILGVVYAAIRGEWLLPAWWILTVVMGTRAFPTLATIPVAMLAAVSLRWVVGPAMLRAGMGLAGVTPGRRLAVGTVGALALLFGIAAALEGDYGDQRYLRALTAAEISAMEWIAEETPSDARFLVLSRNDWYADRDGEWFPALAHRENVATVQGYEWVDGEFARREQLQWMARMCLPAEGNCLGDLSMVEDFDYVYVPETCCEWLRLLIGSEWRWAAVFDNGATVFQRVTGPVRPDEVSFDPDRPPVSNQTSTMNAVSGRSP